jgi:apolipoprotein N-acyltransferase
MPNAPDTADPPSTSSRRRTLALALVGSLLTYLAHPPVGWSLLAWIGPAPWALLAIEPRLVGRRPYRALWLAGFLHWLVTIQWIRLPYWANIFGLFLLAAYLGAYLPTFVALTRVAIHRLRVPAWMAAPIVWIGLEWVRARFLTGFLMASLAHTQVDHLHVIQIADLFGEYGVTFLIMLVAASLAQTIHRARVGGDGHVADPPNDSATAIPAHAIPHSARSRFVYALSALPPAAIALALALGYGNHRLIEGALAMKTPDAGPTIALIQSDMQADWKGTADRDIAVMKQMTELSREAVAKSPRPVALVVWPETMYRNPLLMLDPENSPPAEIFDPARLDSTRRELAGLAKELNAAVMVGLDRYAAVKDDHQTDEEGCRTGYRIEAFNSTACVDPAGKLQGTYDKMHLLPFGEYIPFVAWLPFLRNYSPITGAAIQGKLPNPIVVGDALYSVNICYETVLPHIIRRQFNHLSQTAGRPPDVLVNLTNDAWYWGSSELDMHLASGVFRAIEMRRPLVIAANRGLSAHVNHLGRVVAVSERDVPAYVLANVRIPREPTAPSFYARWGDWPAFGCLLCCIVFGALGWLKRGTSPPTP